MNVKKYGVFGPFDVPRHDDKCVPAPKYRRVFWREVEKNDPGLPNARGCYIFGVRASKGAKPWYVGQTKKSFQSECFESHKLLHYNEALAGYRKGTPVLLFLARQTPKGKFQKRFAASEADDLEYLLIGNCLRANQRLLNISRTSLFREAEIPGLLNSPKGKPSKSAKFLSRLLNLGR